MLLTKRCELDGSRPGASNWTTARIQEAIDYARANAKAEMMSSSPNFSLGRANEPFWPDTVVTSEADRRWVVQDNSLLMAWSALGRGFFAKAIFTDTSDIDLVRVFYSDGNFERKRRAEEFGQTRNMNMFEIALAYVLSQDFPVVALNGVRGQPRLNAVERDWLDLSSNDKPF